MSESSSESCGSMWIEGHCELSRKIRRIRPKRLVLGIRSQRFQKKKRGPVPVHGPTLGSLEARKLPELQGCRNSHALLATGAELLSSRSGLFRLGGCRLAEEHERRDAGVAPDVVDVLRVQGLVD